MEHLIRVRRLKVLNGFQIEFTFTDDSVRIIDLDRYLSDDSIFGPLRTDPALFGAARVEHGTIVWPNGADIDPDVLYLGLPPDASEEEWRAAEAAHAAQVTR